MAKDIVIGGSTYYGATYLQVKTTAGEDAIFTDADNATFWSPAVTSSIQVGAYVSVVLDSLNASASAPRVNISIA